MSELTAARLFPRKYVLTDISYLTDLVLLAVLWCLASVVVNPVGEFPMIDDWSFTRTVNHLIATGEFRPLGWAVMSLLTNVLWGALFCLPDGFSFTALRISSLVAGLLGIFGAYVLVRDLQQPRWLALLLAVSLGLNPIYFALSFTFMTDVLFICLAIWAAVFLRHALISPGNSALVVGTALALAATLSRQLALFLPLAFALTMLARAELNGRSLARAFMPLLVCAGALFVYNYWLQENGRQPALYGSLTDIAVRRLLNPSELFKWLFHNAYFALGSMGLFLLPIVVLWADVLRRVRVRVVTILALGIVLLAVLSELFGPRYNEVLMPIPDRGSILGKPGIGPLSMRDTQLLRLDEHVPAFPTAVWGVVTVICMLGAILLLLSLAIKWRQLMPLALHRRRPMDEMATSGVFLLLCALIYVPVFLLIGFFDRYLLPAAPFFAAGLIALSARGGEPTFAKVRTWRPLAFILAATIGLFSVASTRDYLGWSRIRWQALAELTGPMNVDPRRIDGGFEFNGWHFYDPSFKPDPSKSSWWVHDDTYLVGFGPVPGYGIIKEYSYQHWLPPRTQKIVIMKKN